MYRNNISNNKILTFLVFSLISCSKINKFNKPGTTKTTAEVVKDDNTNNIKPDETEDNNIPISNNDELTIAIPNTAKITTERDQILTNIKNPDEYLDKQEKSLELIIKELFEGKSIEEQKRITDAIKVDITKIQKEIIEKREKLPIGEVGQKEYAVKNAKLLLSFMLEDKIDFGFLYTQDELEKEEERLRAELEEKNKEFIEAESKLQKEKELIKELEETLSFNEKKLEVARKILYI